MGLPTARVSVFFSAGNDFRKRDVSKLASQLVEIVQNHMPGPDESRDIEFDDVDEWPDPIASLTVTRSRFVTSNQWARPEAAFEQTHGCEFLQSVLDTKNKRVASYRKQCGTAWLLIVRDGFELSSTFEFSEEAFAHHYPMEFDRAFVFEVFGRKVRELQKAFAPVIEKGEFPTM
jgi:hypothetical protein